MRVGVQCGGDAVQERDGGDHAACFEPRERGLDHDRPGGELDLRQADGQATFADGAAEQLGALGFRAALAVVVAGHVRMPRGRGIGERARGRPGRFSVLVRHGRHRLPRSCGSWRTRSAR